MIPVDNEKKSVKVRVIDLVTDLVSREKQMDIEPIDGEIKPDPDKDILKIAVITEGDQGMRSFVGLIKGVGIKKGAFASTAVWDTCAMFIVGASDEDMAKAANRVIALKGGIVVFEEGRAQAELPLTIGGVVADLPMETISQCLDDIQQKMTDLGSPLSDAHLSITVFTSPAIPFIRISEEGLVDTKP